MPAEEPPSRASDERAVDPQRWRGRRVLVTGHSGFKGAWLTLWLERMGAAVSGLSHGLPSSPSLYELALAGEGSRGAPAAGSGAGASREEAWVDVRDAAAVRDAVAAARPEVAFHLAAQPLVRRSFRDPAETYETNVMGTVNVLEALRAADCARAIVVVTSDKCYENREWEWGYREHEPLGGHDPYSSSKAAAELVTAAYRRSFGLPLASARAGNVIGGGDWGEDRLVPDVVRAAAAGSRLEIRAPDAIRPWQHVLNPLSGYLLLAERIAAADGDLDELAGAWNFGPPEEDARPVRAVVERLAELWPGGLAWGRDERPRPHEAHYLKLDSSKSRARLGWRPRWDLDEALRRVVEWHAAHARGEDVRALTLSQIDAYTEAPCRRA